MPTGRTRATAGSGPGSRSARPRLVVAGASGRLGRAIVTEALAQGFPVSGAVDRYPSTGAGPAPPVRVADRESLETLLEDAEVYLTATTPEAERANLPVVAKLGVPAVVATTGLGSPLPTWLTRCARQIPIVLDSNFSLGMAILRTAVRSVGALPDGFDVSIVESHRRDKVDHPSGTARSLATDLAGTNARGWRAASGRRAPGVIEIASLRGGETPGIHLVQIAGRNELLRFEHVAYGREAFADGMLLAARWLHERRRNRTAGIYTLRDVLREVSV